MQTIDIRSKYTRAQVCLIALATMIVFDSAVFYVINTSWFSKEWTVLKSVEAAILLAILMCLILFWWTRKLMMFVDSPRQRPIPFFFCILNACIMVGFFAWAMGTGTKNLPLGYTMIGYFISVLACLPWLYVLARNLYGMKWDATTG